MKQRFENIDNIFISEENGKRKLYIKRAASGEKIPFHAEKSKLAAAILKGMREMPIKKTSNVLYLGAASGTTANYVAEIAYKGSVYCVEISPRVAKKLIELCREKKNMHAIIADARKPLSYASFVSEIDVIYQDIAQKDQSEILMKNSELYEPEYALLALKTSSIDSTAPKKEVLKKEIKKLEKKFEIEESIELSPYHSEHYMLVLKRKSK